MPESPECKLVVDSLQEIVNYSITNFYIYPKSKFKNDLQDGYKSTLKLFKQKLPLKIKAIKCYGKFIYFELADGWYLFNSLGMTGVWSFNEEKHSAIKFELERDEKTESLYFSDVRHFGNVTFGNKQDLDTKLALLGPDMLSNPPTAEEFICIARKFQHENICIFLMNQARIAGVGNYIKSESLHRAQISPLVKINELNDIRLEELFNSIRAVMTESYETQGCSLRDYKDARGQEGKFAEKLQVYSKKKWNNYDVIKIKTPDGRSSFYVEENIK